MRRGVWRLKGRKAAGLCGIEPEMLRAGGEVVVEWLTDFFNMVWRAGVAPGNWKDAAINGNMEMEVEARIESAVRVIGGRSEAVLRRKDLSKKTKLKVMDATMLPTLVYGSEMWNLSKQHSQESKPHRRGYCEELKE